jgi:hypothetical protein
MNKKSYGLIAGAVAALTLAAPASAALIDRGGGLIYDDVLNITWMQDASYAATAGAAPYGGLQWQEAHDFAANLEYYDTVRGVVWDDWRLPSTINAETSHGWDLSGQSSELAYMYYTNLGYAADYEPIPTDPMPSGAGYNPFINLVYRNYWSDTLAYNEYGDVRGAWFLHMHFGEQGIQGLNDYLKVWVVRDGDVAATITPPASVPEPGTLGLLGMALGTAGFLRRRKQVSA